jgi:hypothetical protein
MIQRADPGGSAEVLLDGGPLAPPRSASVARDSQFGVAPVLEHPAIGVGCSEGLVGSSAEPFGVDRLRVAGAVAAVAVTTFALVWLNTDVTAISCNDTPTPIEVSAICAVPGRSVLPALPLAALAAAATLVVLVWRRRQRSAA